MDQRDFRIRDLNSSNSILIGYTLSNPWVEVFHQTLNFVMEHDPAGNTRSIANLHPQRDEPERLRRHQNVKHIWKKPPLLRADPAPRVHDRNSPLTAAYNVRS